MRKFLTVISFGVLLASCTQDEVTETAASDCNENFTYDNDVQPIIMNNCATSGCHDGTQPPLLTNFTLVEASKSRVKARAIDLKTMPPSGPLTDSEIQKISCWIEQGAVEE